MSLHASGIDGYLIVTCVHECSSGITPGMHLRDRSSDSPDMSRPGEREFDRGKQFPTGSRQTPGMMAMDAEALLTGSQGHVSIGWDTEESKTSESAGRERRRAPMEDSPPRGGDAPAVGMEVEEPKADSSRDVGAACRLKYTHK